jgi:uncharacterized protein Usg
MFSAERKPRRGFPATSLDQPVSTFKTGVLGSLVGLKLLILRWYQIEATRQREIDFHIPKTLTKAGPMPHTAFLRQLEGFSLTTAEILYRLPGYPRLLQSYIWQDYDLAPKLPKLVDFLDYWVANLDGPLYRVRVAHRRLIAPQEFKLHRGRAQIELTGLLLGTLS